VGDLPPGTTPADLADLLSQLASVVSAHIAPGGAAYGFVALESADDVDAVLDLATRNPLVLKGRPVRVARAKTAVPGGGLPTHAATAPDPAATHPRAVAAREAARAVADAALASGGVDGGAGGDGGGGRQLVCYDDL
jgi:hypothetical protein